MFLKSPICSSSHAKRGLLRGFTLVELLVSIAIIVIITSIVLVRYDKFDSTVLLKNTAYDVALTIREAQVRSVSAMRGDGVTTKSKYPYGVTFTPGATLGKEYTSFRYNDEISYPRYTGGTATVNDILKMTIDRTMYISDVCAVTGMTYNCTINRLDISFRRPEFKALFYADGYAGAMSSIDSVAIVLESPNGAEKFEVSVTRLGQITVQRHF